MPRPINILAKYKLLSIGEEGFAVYAEECKLLDAKKKIPSICCFHCADLFVQFSIFTYTVISSTQLGAEGSNAQPEQG